MIENAIVVGTGGVANFCALELQKRGVAVSFWESRADNVGTSEAICRKRGIPYEQLSKENLTMRLKGIKDKTLVVSASNRYLFPAEVLANKNLVVVNYHGALLPKHPGRNAEAWAIFSQDAEGGITWHRVVADVDAGDILIQKSVPITDKTTSFTLLREYAKLAQLGFAEIVDGLLSETQPSFVQQGERHAIMYSWMKPNDGILDLSWSFDKMSAFLRAMDYGPLSTMGFPVVTLDEGTFKIVKYGFDTNSSNASSGWVKPLTEYHIRHEGVVIDLEVKKID